MRASDIQEDASGSGGRPLDHGEEDLGILQVYGSIGRVVPVAVDRVVLALVIGPAVEGVQVLKIACAVHEDEIAPAAPDDPEPVGGHHEGGRSRTAEDARREVAHARGQSVQDPRSCQRLM